MSAANKAACFKETEFFEGWHKFSNDKYDPGGATWSGTTQSVDDAWRVKQGLPKHPVRQASDDEIESIWSQQYWEPVRGDDLFAGMDLVLEDIGYNSGPIRAIKFLQQAIGVTVDGHFGLLTLAKLNEVAKTEAQRETLIRKICAMRMSYWHSLTTWWRFGKGWSSRGQGILAKALNMNTPVSIPAVKSAGFQ